MPTVFFLPGLLGSTLSQDAAGQYPIWVSYTQLILGQTGKLRLSADGITPGPPDGITLYPQAPLADYFAAPSAQLQGQLASAGYSVVQQGYDWRYALLSQSTALYDSIVQNVTPDDPCTIVGYSYGGIVARQVWAQLLAAGQQSLVRRLITLGTPHQGSYAPVALWSGDNLSVRQLAALAALGSGLYLGAIPAVITYLWTPDQIEAVVCTWPSFYAVLPTLGGTAAAADPNRQYLYTASHWQDVPVSQSWLDYASSTISPFLLSAASLPPTNVLTTIAGEGVPTPNTLVFPALLGTPAAYGSTGAGDGQVTTLSALIPQSWQYTVPAAHSDLYPYCVSTGLLAAEILTQRSAPTPPPPVQVEPGTIVPLLAGPPVASLTFPPLGPLGDC